MTYVDENKIFGSDDLYVSTFVKGARQAEKNQNLLKFSSMHLRQSTLVLKYAITAVNSGAKICNYDSKLCGSSAEFNRNFVSDSKVRTQLSRINAKCKF
jgi:hypothetical protein